MRKKSVKPKKLMDIRCPKCGRVTRHYLNEAGEYKCVVCQSVNKTIKVQEVVFEMSPELDSALNPDPVEEILTNAGTETADDAPVLDDQGNPV